MPVETPKLSQPQSSVLTVTIPEQESIYEEQKQLEMSMQQYSMNDETPSFQILPQDQTASEIVSEISN